MVFKRAGSVLVMSAALAGVLGLGAGSAIAATHAITATWTVKPGGAITAKAGKTTLKDKNTGSVLTCTSSSGKGTAKKGSGLSGSGIASITSLGFSHCTGPLNLTFSVHTTHFPWKLNARSFSGGVTTGSITRIHATLSGPSCSATVDGTGASANNGSVTAKYSNGTGKLTTTGAGNLHVYNVSGCGGLISKGDAGTITGSYKVSPLQKITSP
jgi:hypothetical protein